MDAFRWGLIPNWSKGRKDRLENDQCARRNGRYRAGLSRIIQKAPLPASGRWILRMEAKREREAAVFNPTKGRHSVLLRGFVGRLENPGTEDWLRTCTIITCEPNEFVRQIHTRMPVILPEQYFQGWLSGAMGKEILEPYPADLMSAWPISTRVNSPANNDPGIVERVDNGFQIRKRDSADGLLL